MYVNNIEFKFYMYMKGYSVPGRVCLFGDHMDWIGKSVITLAIHKRIFCKIKKNDSNICRLKSYAPFDECHEMYLNEITINHETDFRYIEGVLSVLKKEYELNEGFDLEIFKPHPNIGQTLPAGKGLSSSASLCVASTAAIMSILDATFSRRTDFTQFCAENAYIDERNVLGINCGRMDPYACALGGIQFINCNIENFYWQRLGSLSNLSVVIGDSCKKKDTERILEWLKYRYEDREQTLLQGIKEISKIVFEAYLILSQAVVDSKKLGKLMDRNQYFIQNNLLTSGDCPISSSNLNELIHATKKAGAIGAKVTGSGGGGCMIALCNKKRVDNVMKAIIDIGGVPINVLNSDSGILTI